MMGNLPYMFLVKAALLFLATIATALPPSRYLARDAGYQSSKLVFAHFMVGITSDRSGPADYDNDMIRAKNYGIDAFALNIGVDDYTDQQLGYAYASAASNGMKVFISFDFYWYNVSSDAQLVGEKIKNYANESAQLIFDGKVVASSYLGDGLDVPAMRQAAAPTEVFWAPNVRTYYEIEDSILFWAPKIHSYYEIGDFEEVDAALSWMAWENNGNNRAPDSSATITVQEGDQAYIAALNGKPYIAPASPWFSTHFGPEVPYSKNWVFPSDLLWFERWSDILTLSPPIVEIVSWNDYGECHYVGPLSSKHTDDGSSKWANDMPHDGWLDMAKPFIDAFHAGNTSIDGFVESDQLIYWYRTTLRDVSCNATDNCGSPPDGWQIMADSVFVVSLLKSPGTVTVTSGSLPPVSFNATAGASSFSAPMGVGPQGFALNRGGQDVLNGTSLHDVSSVCTCGFYNFNAFVGTLPPSFSDPLGPDSLTSFSSGLPAAICEARPSLATAMPYQTNSCQPPEVVGGA